MPDPTDLDQLAQVLEACANRVDMRPSLAASLEAAAALRRLEKLERALLADSGHQLMIIQSHPAGRCELRLGTRPPVRKGAGSPPRSIGTPGPIPDRGEVTAT